jgi:hypothetical protein
MPVIRSGMISKTCYYYCAFHESLTGIYGTGATVSISLICSPIALRLSWIVLRCETGAGLLMDVAISRPLVGLR